MLTQQKVLNFPITLGSYDQFVHQVILLAEAKKSTYVCVAAVHQLIEAYKDQDFARISEEANLVSPDGMPITWALKFLYNIKQDKVSGPDLLPSLLHEAEAKSLSVYFYGGTQQMLDRTTQEIKVRYPALQIAGSFSPPFRPLLEAEKLHSIQQINGSNANLVFVVLGCPKQERWMYEMKGKINATMVGIGAALPVLVGLQKRAPKWMQNSGLEWLYRLGQEPGRLWKRYLSTNSLFIYLVIAEKIKIVFNPSKYALKTKP